VDRVLVFHADQRPLQLHGRRQLLVVGSEDLLDEAELLDGLDPRELPVHALDLAPDQVPDFGGAAERGEVGERDVPLLGVVGHRLVVDHDQAREELSPVADDHRVGDVGRELELVLDLRRRDVLAARRDDDVLHAVGDPDEPLVVPFTNFASLCRATEIRDLIWSEIERVNRQLARVETIKKFRLIEQILTADDEELTPTMKLKRALVSTKYKDVIDAMYAER